jgi:hypothetical protein
VVIVCLGQGVVFPFFAHPFRYNFISGYFLVVYCTGDRRISDRSLLIFSNFCLKSGQASQVPLACKTPGFVLSSVAPRKCRGPIKCQI